MTPAEAKACAEFLGAKRLVPAGEVIVQPGRYTWYAEFPDRSHYPSWTDADLFYALLLRAQQLDVHPHVILEERDAYAVFWNTKDCGRHAATPLAALVAAVCKYQEKQP